MVDIQNQILWVTVKSGGFMIDEVSNDHGLFLFNKMENHSLLSKVINSVVCPKCKIDLLEGITRDLVGDTELANMIDAHNTVWHGKFKISTKKDIEEQVFTEK